MSLVLSGDNGVTFPNSTVQASAGQVLQVVNATYATETVNTTSTYVDTGLTATITPKFATSEILVLVNITGGKFLSDTYMGLRLLRGSTVISNIANELGYTNSTALNDVAVGTNYSDSPATTSATTYKLQFASLANTARVFICGSGSVATITLMEIAA